MRISQAGKNNPNWRGGPVRLKCQWCGIDYYVTRALVNTSVACSRKCNAHIQSKKSHAKKRALQGPPKPRENKASTKRIKQSFIWGEYSSLAEAKKCGHLTKKSRRYCQKCTPKGKGVVTKECVICGGDYTAYKSAKRKTCSDECGRVARSIHQIGEKSHRWQGGKTDEARRLRNSYKYDNWRKEVFIRDDYTCQKCGQKGGRLTADHIKPWALYPMLRFSLDNGRTLCWECHSKLDTTGFRLSVKTSKEKREHGGVQYRMF